MLKVSQNRGWICICLDVLFIKLWKLNVSAYLFKIFQGDYFHSYDFTFLNGSLVL